MSSHTLLAALAIVSASFAGAVGVASEPVPTSEHVHIAGFDFDPGTLTVPPGTTVDWDNHDGTSHTVTATDGSWDSGSIAPGGSYSRVFEEEGTFPYVCAFHAGMEGTIIVETPEPPNVPPTVAITTPDEGAVVTGLVEFEGTAGDADGAVTRVDVAVGDGPFRRADGTTGWSFVVDTDPLEDGPLTVTARAFDGDDFSALATVNLTVRHPQPTLTITAPADGAVVTGLVEVTGTAAVENGTIERVEVALDDGAFTPVTGTSAWSFTLDTDELPDGAYTLTARAFDGRKLSEPETLTLTVEHPRYPDVTIPSVTTRGNALRQTLDARVANVGDAPAGTFDVTFYYAYKGDLHLIDTVTVPILATGAQSTVSVDWDTTLKVGSFPIIVRADEAGRLTEWDASNNTGEGSARVGVALSPRDLTDP